MKVTFEGTIHEVLDQIEDFCKSVIKESTPEVKVVAPSTIVTLSPEAQAVILGKSIETVIVDEFEPPCPTHDEPEVEKAPEDLTAACMSIVNGDKAKKAALMAILAEYDCNTVRAIHVNDRGAIWARVKDL